MAKYTFLKDTNLSLPTVWEWAKKLVTDLNNGIVSQSGSGSVPAGAQMFWLSAEAPLGWLICDGSSYPIADYAALFLQIGYTYGGAGPLFLLPDLRNRILMGAGTSVALGAVAGSLTKTIGAANLPAHTHPVTDPGHTHVFTGTAHHHSGGASATGNLAGTASGLGLADTGDTVAAGTNSNVHAGITVGANTGGGTPMDVLNPVFGINVIIKT